MQDKIIRIGGLVGVLIAALLIVSPMAAQGPSLENEVNRIAKTLYCPVCPNTPLDVCTTKACEDWRAEIRQLLQEGKNEQQIREYFLARYGPQVLGAPPAEGFNWLAYLFPFLLIGVGALVAWFTLQQWSRRRRADVTPPETPEIPREYAERIRKELEER